MKKNLGEIIKQDMIQNRGYILNSLQLLKLILLEKYDPMKYLIFFRVANYCENYCIYCGFNCHNKIRRAQLNEEEIEKELGTQLEKSKGDMKAIMRAGQNYAEKMYSLRMMYEKENKRLIKEWDRKVEEQDSCR